MSRMKQPSRGAEQIVEHAEIAALATVAGIGFAVTAPGGGNYRLVRRRPGLVLHASDHRQVGDLSTTITLRVPVARRTAGPDQRRHDSGLPGGWWPLQAARLDTAGPGTGSRKTLRHGSRSRTVYMLGTSQVKTVPISQRR